MNTSLTGCSLNPAYPCQCFQSSCGNRVENRDDDLVVDDRSQDYPTCDSLALTATHNSRRFHGLALRWTRKHSESALNTCISKGTTPPKSVVRNLTIDDAQFLLCLKQDDTDMISCVLEAASKLVKEDNVRVQALSRAFLDLVVETMHRHSKNAVISSHALRIIGILTNNYAELTDSVSRHMKLDLVLACLRANPTNGHLYYNAFWVFGNLAAHQVSSRALLVGAGLFEDVVRALHAHSAFASLHNGIFWFLGNICKQAEYRPRISRLLCIHTVMHIMRSAMSHARLLGNILSYLCKLAHTLPEIRFQLVDFRYVCDVVRAMALHPNFAQLHSTALRLLCCVSHSAALRGDVTFQLDLEPVLTSLRSHSAHIHLCSNGLWLLGNLAYSASDARQYLLDHGFASDIMYVIRLHDRSVSVLDHAFWTLSSLSKEVDRRHEMVNYLSTAEIMEILRKNPTSYAVHSNAFSLLGNLAYNLAEVRTGMVSGGYVHDVVQIMTAQPSSSQLQIHAMWLLGNITKQADLRAEVAKSVRVPLLLESMKLHLDRCHLVANALWVLANFACSLEDVKVEMARQGAVSVIIESLQRHPLHAQLHSNAMWCISSLTSLEDVKTIFTTPGYLSVLVESMERHMDRQQLQSDALWALARLLSREEIQVEVISRGILGMVALSMQQHITQSAVQSHGLCVMALSAGKEAARQAIARHGYVKRVIDALRQHQDVVQVQVDALFTLATLCTHDDIQTAAVEAGCVTDVTSAMARHPFHTGVQIIAFWTLRNLSRPDRSFPPMNENHPILQIQASLKRLPTVRGVHLCGWSTLCALANRDKSRDELLELLKLDDIMDALRSHNSDPEVQAYILDVIAHLAMEDKVCLEVARKGHIPVIMETLELHSNDIEVQSNALWCLGNLTEQEEISAYMHKHGHVTSVIEALRRHPDSLDIQAVGMLALGNLADNLAEIRTMALQDSWHEDVTRALKKHIQEVSVTQYAFHAVASLALHVELRTLLSTKEVLSQAFLAISCHHHTPSALSVILLALSRLSLDCTGAALLRGCQEWLDTLLDLLCEYPNHMDIQRYGATILRHCTASHSHPDSLCSCDTTCTCCSRATTPLVTPNMSLH
eukprot:TRINITY_DN2325_c0_g2::TRINITY_DN2325_c0_g2_i1::g.20931::m.20931 TRINITY_DN2325_c0_g2::TRINITY_DN2325_c0_g2_i1::g.20931  ORF type:complete len:1113 (+),score=142.42,sp/Q54I71/AARA_DICDI/26.67/2e-15,sp/Q54I71/AARA_DICDI/21.05/4e-15,sp/Q54I71/AARA_DICDI/20.61/5e-12,sp/Q54I71/AARA_DICDI/21.79/2e-06,Arm/PF00514.18/1.1e+03,Arm/PF00514.18/2.8e+03,Arm/PF00514.18/1.1e+02,Arm/PF00514.18/42,Arm/PF00514.18/4.5e+03,Arm/PF00514.18/1.6e+03,Arm/PF00514.18/74,Arm/PF00514.18/3.2e+02,Arm/PF00514.18/46,Arm/PF00514.